jgi:hypothetical protein
MATPLPLRIQLQNTWRNDIPLKFLWTLHFFPRTADINQDVDMSGIGRNVTNIISRYEGQNKWPIDVNIFNRQSDPSNTYGYMFAQGVAFSSDAFDVNTPAAGTMGGNLPGYVSGNRLPYGGSNGLNITFLETNIDIIDSFIRPWIIAASHKGLIEDNKEDIKCNILINYFTRDSGLQNTDIITPDTVVSFQRRKSFVFEDVVPFQVKGDEVSYNGVDFNELQKIVSFAYNKYYTIPVIL